MADKRVLIGLGSNMGDSAAFVCTAIDDIAAIDGVELIATSGLYESEPAYREDQELFCNAVIEVQTNLNPYELLTALQSIENELGRVRMIVNGPRVIDLDIIDYEGVVSDDPVLLLPHPLALERDFIITPLLEIAPGHVLADGEAVTREAVTVGKIASMRNYNEVHNDEEKRPSGKLLICATPIGNLGDITQRVVKALAQADIVLAEDTRIARRLLSHLNLRVRIERCDENTIRQNTATIIKRIKEGTIFAFISDAGMPGIADPGAFLVDAVYESGCSIEVLPGASAVTTAVAASGFIASAFYFGGFLPRKRPQIMKLLEQLADLNALLIFFESPHRAVASLEIIATVFPMRKVALMRELTKLHEEVLRNSALQLVQQLKEREAQGQPVKGEVALVIDVPQRTTSSRVHRDRYTDKRRSMS